MSGDLPLNRKLEFRATTNSSENRDSSVMISSVMPSLRYSCPGSLLMLVKGRTAIEGLSGRSREGVDGREPAFARPASSSSTVPTKRMPFRGTVLMRRCAFPVSSIAHRAALMRVVMAESETIRPAQTEAIKSSLLTSRSRFRIRYSRRSKACGSSRTTSPRRHNSRRSVSSE